MFGLILAALYVAFSVLFYDTNAGVAVESTLPFLWYWHMTFAVIKAVIWLIVPIIGIGLGTFADKTDAKLVGLGMLLGSPILLVLMAISSALFLGGIYGIDSGLQGGEVVNQSHLVIGSILYGLGALSQLSSRSSSSSKSD